ncbi:MAG: DUF456 domain-containing protein [Nocardioides sp.]|nr:DUF456 domain-containing protein [Nocardioides sp.]
MTGLDVVVALVIALGVVGTLVPVLPGSVLVLGAVLVWAVQVRTEVGWVVLAAVGVLLVVGGVVKYVVPGRRLNDAGIPASPQWVGAGVGVVGVFVVAVIGLLAGVVLGVYAAARRRLGSALAWPSTRAALRAVGLSIVIELVAALLAAGTWVVGVVLV